MSRFKVGQLVICIRAGSMIPVVGGPTIKPNEYYRISEMVAGTNCLLLENQGYPKGQSGWNVSRFVPATGNPKELEDG